MLVGQCDQSGAHAGVQFDAVDIDVYEAPAAVVGGAGAKTIQSCGCGCS